MGVPIATKMHAREAHKLSTSQVHSETSSNAFCGHLGIIRIILDLLCDRCFNVDSSWQLIGFIRRRPHTAPGFRGARKDRQCTGRGAQLQGASDCKLWPMVIWSGRGRGRGRARGTRRKQYSVLLQMPPGSTDHKRFKFNYTPSISRM